jgi:glycerol uptake facilitator-like aquaporin
VRLSLTGAVAIIGAMEPDLAPRGPRAYAAEFAGTLLLAFFVGLAFVPLTAGGVVVVDLAVIGLVHLLVLATLVAVLGPASGAHLNPAITVAFAALRRIGPVDALAYVVLQVAGAVAGALLVELLLADGGAGAAAVAQPASPRIADERLAGDALPAFAAELVGAALLAAAYVAGRTPFIIGAAFGVAVLTLAPLTGAALNPARALGASIAVGGEPAGTFVVAYVLGPLVGALLGAAGAAALRGPADEAAAVPPVAAPVARPVDTLDPA